MKEYSLFVDDAVVGPLPQQEIEAKIKSGELPADVLVAAPGDAEWRPAKDVFNIRMGVRLSRKTEAEEQRLREARQEKLDPEVRKKLMLYDLADAISVDKFSSEEATAAIAQYESALARKKYMKIGLGIGAFILVFGGIYFTLDAVKLSGINRGLLAPITEMMVAPNEEYPQLVRSTAKDIEDLAKFREEVEALEFKMPNGGKDPRRDFIKRVYIPKEQSKFISGKIDASPLLSRILPEGVTPTAIDIFFSQRVSNDVKKIVQEEIDLLALLKNPLWTDEELAQKLTEELGPELPCPDGVKRLSENYLRQLSKITAAEIAEQPARWAKLLEQEIYRQDSQGRFYRPEEKERLLTRAPSKELLAKLGSAKLKKEIENMPKDSPSKLAVVRWCVSDMPAFLDKFQKFVDDNRINYSQAYRDELWKSFTDKNKAAILEEFEVPAMSGTTIAEDGSFRIARDNERGMCLRIQVGDVALFIPEDLRFKSEEGGRDVKAFSAGKIERENVKPEDRLLDEKYTVAKKISVGGKTYYATGKIQRKPVKVFRKSPVLNYIEVERVGEADPRSKDTKNICLLVPDESEFNGMAVGASVPMEQLLGYQLFNQPRETQAPSKLTLQRDEVASEDE